MLEAPALSARSVSALIDPSGAPTATEPGACSSPRPPGVMPAMSSGTAGAAVAHAGAASR